ncbi:MAG: glycosyl hydrolase, partial [Acidobacteriota bacterium]
SLLFLGTELGLWISLDDGAQWARFEGGVPAKVSVRDLAIQPRKGDLIIATHGRGIYILDDLTPLRNLTADILEQSVALLPTRPAEMTIPSITWPFSGAGEYTGPNPPEAAQIAYYMKRRHLFGDLKVEVYDQDGELVKTVPGSKRRGINRVEWPMRLPSPKVPPATNLVPAFEGPRVPEGVYTIKLIKGSETLTGQVELVPDPRTPHSAEDRRLQQETALDLYEMLERMTYLVDALIDLRDQVRERAEAVESDRLTERLEGYADELEELRTSLVATSEAGWLSGDEKLREDLGNLYGAVNGYTGRPTQSQLDRVEILRGRLDDAFSRFEEVASRRDDHARALERAGAEPLVLLTREAWEEREER